LHFAIGEAVMPRKLDPSLTIDLGPRPEPSGPDVYYEHAIEGGNVFFTGLGPEEEAYNIFAAGVRWPRHAAITAENRPANVEVRIVSEGDVSLLYQQRTMAYVDQGLEIVNIHDKRLLVARRKRTQAQTFTKDPRAPLYTGIRQTGPTSFTARIRHKGDFYHLGTFRTFDEALAARQEAERTLGVVPREKVNES
jgi:hypothetical protein